MFIAPLKSKERGKIQNMDISKTSDHIQIRIKMPNSSQEPQASSKAPNKDLMDMNILGTFKIKIENQKSEHVCIKDHWSYPNKDQDNQPKSESSSIP